jgi:hypothetical protein
MLSAHALLCLTTAWVCRSLLARCLLTPILTAAIAAFFMLAALRLAGAWPVTLQIALGAVLYAFLAGPPLWHWARHVRSASSR